MTSHDFLDNIYDLDDLSEFCYDNGAEDFFSDRYIETEGGLRSWIDDYYLTYLFENYDWSEIRYYLNRVADMLDDYYWFDLSEGHPEGISSRGDIFDDLKEEVYRWALDEGIFDDADDEGNGTVEHMYQTQHVDTQVKWNCKIEKVENTYEEPQGDISLIF